MNGPEGEVIYELNADSRGLETVQEDSCLQEHHSGGKHHLRYYIKIEMG